MLIKNKLGMFEKFMLKKMLSSKIYCSKKSCLSNFKIETFNLSSKKFKFENLYSRKFMLKNFYVRNKSC